MEIYINGNSFPAKPEQMIIEVADAAGIYIPRFCYHPKLSIAANCRQCMVEVDGVRKPLPACATPVSPDMKVHTASTLAKEAQEGTLEFLLINHPLDCPICDQGGECPLQDQSLGYGQDHSRFSEKKRTVLDHDKGPLIATEMTRCIHCTRCVRFGQEIAGQMEFSAFGRGEHTTIGTYLNHTVESEISGNVIDICPVGALTSKPSRFRYRPWELSSYPSIAPHDCMGSNIKLQTLRRSVRRIVPEPNEAINECWISNRDRYAWQGFDSEDRLTEPMQKINGKWQTVGWQEALHQAAKGISSVLESFGDRAEYQGSPIGALVSTLCSAEEGYLMARLLRALNSDHIDYRLREIDTAPVDYGIAPTLGRSIASLSNVRSVLLLGSNIRKEQPLLAVRLRRSQAHKEVKIHALNPLDFDHNFNVGQNLIAEPSDFYVQLQSIAAALAKEKNIPVPEALKDAEVQDAHQHIAADLVAAGEKAAIISGQHLISHPNSYALRELARWIAQQCGASFGVLDAGNATGLWAAGVRPMKAGFCAHQMLAAKLPCYILMGVEPEFDCAKPHAALEALNQADCVIALSSYHSRASEYASLILPIALYGERNGSHVNCQGKVQTARAAIAPAGESKSAWKVLRVLANMLNLEGFSYMKTADLTNQLVDVDVQTSSEISNKLAFRRPSRKPKNGALRCIYDVPAYRLDAVLRRADCLQDTQDNPGPKLRLNPDEAKDRLLDPESELLAGLDGSEVQIGWCADERVPRGCVYIPATFAETQSLNIAQGSEIEVKKLSASS